MRELLRKVSCLLMVLGIASGLGGGPCLRAQAGLSGGSIAGRVVDTTGAAVAGARIALSSSENAASRMAESGPEGEFRFRNLPSGTYRLEVSAAGFRKYGNEAVVAVGRETRLEVRLAPAQARELVTVSAETPALDVSQPSPVTNIDRDRIEELPIPSRNYLNFTLLAPSMENANAAQMRRTPGAVEGGFSAGGLRPQSNALAIDGADDDDECTGLSRTELSPEAISDFQVVNHGYEARWGGAAGGAVEVETRMGANLQHGDAFLFVQNGALNAVPALELAPYRPDENRLRAGLSTGGAWRRAKLFYYAAGELEMARGEEASDLSAQTAAQIDGALAQAGPLRGFRVGRGFFPTTNEETELSGRVDRDWGRSSGMLRYALTNNRAVNDAFDNDELADVSARGSAFYDDNGLNGEWGWTASPRSLNQASFEASERRVALRTGSTSGPGVVVAGVAELGTPFAGNSRRFETHLDASDAVTMQAGRHLITAGGGEEHVALRAADREGFGGLYVFPDLDTLRMGQPDFFTQSFGDPDTNFSELRMAGFAQDHWTPGAGWALDYGLRWEANLLPAPLHTDAVNFSPRVGFAWSPDKRWVVRGGLGTFFDRYLLATVNRIEEFNGTQAEEQVAEGSAAAALYRAGATYSAPVDGIAPSIWRAQRGMKNPYAETASLGLERELGAQWTAKAEYRFVHGVRMGRTVNTNLPEPVVLTQANAPALGVAAPTPQQMGRLVFPLGRLDPAYDAINEFETEAGSKYNGVTITLNRQFTEDLELMAGYTFSRTTDDASYDAEQPENPYAIRAERARSLEDQRHRFVLSGLWVLGPDLDDPKGRANAGKENAVEKAVYGLEFAPIVEAGSGLPEDPLTGTDSNREHVYPFAARPMGWKRNSLGSPATVGFDLRVLKMVPIWRGHLDIVAESFNLLNRQNVELMNPAFGQNLGPSAEFGQPIQEGDARRVQFSLDYEY